jgi:hypothetical protein
VEPYVTLDINHVMVKTTDFDQDVKKEVKKWTEKDMVPHLEMQKVKQRCTGLIVGLVILVTK